MPALLVVSEAWFPGWHVTIDGRAASAVRADAVALGVVVPQGHHVVRFHYRPPGIRAGAGLMIVTILGFVAWAVVDTVRRRRPAPAADPTGDAPTPIEPGAGSTPDREPNAHQNVEPRQDDG
jgi:hypothetical protein